MICYERWDYEALERIIALDIQPIEIKSSLASISLHRDGDDRVMVRYSTKKGDAKGRLYGNLALQDEKWPEMYWPQGTSLQGLPSWVRHFVAHKFYRDFDIANCAPQMLAQILTRHRLCPYALTYYNENRDAIFEKYSKQYGIPRSEVKTVFIGILHTGKSDERFKESVRLKKELDSALYKLAKLPEYSALYRSVARRPNPLGTFAFTVWSREEHKVLMQMREYFVLELGYHRDHMVLVFDGLMVEKDPVLDKKPIDMTALSKYIKEHTDYDIRVEEKSLLPTESDLALVKSFSK